MTTLNIVQRLREMAKGTPGINCAGCEYECICGSNGCEVMWEAAEKLDTYEQKNAFWMEDQIYTNKLKNRLAEEREKHRWIPVAERLPEKYEDVLITYRIPREKAARIWIGYRAETGWCAYGVHNPNVTAWMQMPDAYEPEDVKQEDQK